MSLLRRMVSIPLLLGTLAATGCASQSQRGAQVEALAALDKRLTGRWRLTSYRPHRTLGPTLLLALGTDGIVISFRNGRVRSETDAMTFDRAMRIIDPFGNRFRAFIKDEQGVEYEISCVFNTSDEIEFEARTDPWRGYGALTRE